MSLLNYPRVGRVQVVTFPDYATVWMWADSNDRNTTAASMWSYDSGSVVFCRPGSGTEVIGGLPPPSETLLSLLRHFHTHRAVAPLLDRLLEEYPQLEEWVNPAEIVAAVTEEVVP